MAENLAWMLRLDGMARRATRGLLPAPNPPHESQLIVGQHNSIAASQPR
jgi:hypothetical protein